ncbi:uncharacterized protein LOC111777588 isoform X1 [Cucurbita pepo subsp. pepo]|uniref:uncharacterized protein LOC111777588 isoform X1 n=1 Tax=Cucurbita pepo subsp. pepo TaxID=3664 RepID=UPI000C9D36C9|nr:uncharacterized protein LOC111777588 isoform X1 [Cucurbita pepo subsp. pepo]XP_023513018.1 uncharacterized protein LOC111777588 isoform X1 [Cucurbita pepo subsp. pepo]
MSFGSRFQWLVHSIFVQCSTVFHQFSDLQSYLSDLNLFVAHESKKFLILVDNRPWLREFGSRPARLWQLMVTKSRLSPFANRKVRRDRNSKRVAYQRPKITKKKKCLWFSLINAVTLSHKKLLLLPMPPVENLRKSFILNNELHCTLYGFIVFEVSWSNVRGINYLNELQTDTSLAVESKYMQRWEFDCISHAAGSVSSWFLGSPSDEQLLKSYLESVTGEIFYDAVDEFDDIEDNFLNNSIPIMEDEIISYKNFCINDDLLECTDGELNLHSTTVEDSANTLQTPPPTGPNKRRKVTRFIGSDNEDDTNLDEMETRTSGFPSVSEIYDANCQDVVEATQYKDVLILFRFNDRDLPFKLKQVIMSDLRLLTLLEAGLPSWVIFLQSYPVFCHVYRPWMCPFARALYVLVSVITVLIGFYDLYKNVPLLKAAASRLCGPLFDWIEHWEMVSRIKYLGTMLFLHNFEKSLTWFLTISRTARSFLAILAQPLASPVVELLGFVLPICNTCIEVVGNFFSVIWDVIDFCGDMVVDSVELLLLPIWFIFSTLWSCVTMILLPALRIISEILHVPIRTILSLASFVTYICTGIYEMFGDVQQVLCSVFQVASVSEVTVATSEVSIWRTLWNDLFSQVFRALRSILNGFVAFFTACNRHRLSIYNYVQECFERLCGRMRGSEQEASSSRRMYKPQRLSRVYGQSLENRKVHTD